MSEQGTQQRGQQQSQKQSPLQSDRGNTVIQDGVVAKVSGIAAQEVEGIRMGSGTSQAVGGLIGSITGGGGGSQTAGVSVEVGEVETAVDLTLTTEYGKPIPRLAEAVRQNVVNRVENLLGLKVTEVNITVGNVYFPQEEQQQVEGQQSSQSS